MFWYPLTGAPAFHSALKAALQLEHVLVALPLGAGAFSADGTVGDAAGLMRAAEDVAVRSIAVCGGSGATVLAGAPADVLVTGEMGHHEVLAAVAAGSAVVLTNHSNCERGWLPQLRERLLREWEGPGGGKEMTGTDLDICVSLVDADPLLCV